MWFQFCLYHFSVESFCQYTLLLFSASILTLMYLLKIDIRFFLFFLLEYLFLIKKSCQKKHILTIKKFNLTLITKKDKENSKIYEKSGRFKLVWSWNAFQLRKIRDIWDPGPDSKRSVSPRGRCFYLRPQQIQFYWKVISFVTKK